MQCRLQLPKTLPTVPEPDRGIALRWWIFQTKWSSIRMPDYQFTTAAAVAHRLRDRSANRETTIPVPRQFRIRTAADHMNGRKILPAITGPSKKSTTTTICTLRCVFSIGHFGYLHDRAIARIHPSRVTVASKFQVTGYEGAAVAAG